MNQRVIDNAGHRKAYYASENAKDDVRLCNNLPFGGFNNNNWIINLPYVQFQLRKLSKQVENSELIWLLKVLLPCVFWITWIAITFLVNLF